MQRRLFLGIAATSVTAFPHLAGAQSQPVEGKDYVAVSPRHPTQDRNRVEILEFFAYGCSHCDEFEPTLRAWTRKLPPDVVFRRIPVAFRDSMVAHQQIYFAIEALGLIEPLHHKVFDAIHRERQRLDRPEDIGAFVARHGVDRTRFLEAMNSFGMPIRLRQAAALVKGYKVEGTPSLGVDGRWLTSGAMAGSHARSLVVTEHLAGLARKAR